MTLRPRSSGVPVPARITVGLSVEVGAAGGGVSLAGVAAGGGSAGALAAGAGDVLGSLGTNIVILGAILATSSAISGTVFGSSRQMAVVAKDGYFPNWLSKRKNNIPIHAIITMALMASILILLGGLELILEFGSITFLLVSLLMAIANYKIRAKTNSSTFVTALSIIGLSIGGILILYYEFINELEQMLAIIFLYIVLGFGAYIYSKKVSKQVQN